MITRLLISAASSVAGSFVGLFFSKRVKKKAAYYDALLDFIAHITSEVKFRKNSVRQICNNFLATSSDTPFNKNLLEFSEASNPFEIVLSRGVLKKSELVEVRQFLASIGTLDSETQIMELELAKEKFSTLSKKNNETKHKFSSMYVKLGFLAGLALGIILL